ncbi:MAG: hypothetical protein AAF561_02570, partial [Planctomycetota bacterium]
QWLSGSGAHPTLSGAGSSTIRAELFINPTNPLPTQALPRLDGLDIGTFFFVSLAGPSDQPWLLEGTDPLTIGQGELDIGNQNLVVRDTDGPAIGLVASEIASAYAGGVWNGRGLSSSIAGGPISIGYGNPADVVLDDELDLFAAPPDDVFVGLTVAGDADLDRDVDLADFGRLRAGFGSGSLWAEGDFNYDGTVNLADFGLLRANFGNTFTPPYAPISLFDE